MLMRFFPNGKRDFASLDQREILALAISSEEDDGRIYRSYADWLRKDYPDSAKIFDEMAVEEDEHRRWLIDLYREKFGETIPLIRREHVRGFYHRTPDWLVKPQGRRRGAQAGGGNGKPGLPLLCRSRPPRHRRLDPQADGRPRPGRSRPYRRGHAGGKGACARDREGGRGRRRAPPVRPHLCPARPCRADGRLRLDARADLRRRLRHAGYLDDVSRRPRRFARRGHLNGLHRSRVRRRRDLGPRLAHQARPCNRHHDRGRRSRPRAALPHPAFLDRHRHRHRRRVRRALGHRLSSRTATWKRRGTARSSRSCSAARSSSPSAC